jgi:hypothetical protein
LVFFLFAFFDWSVELSCPNKYGFGNANELCGNANTDWSERLILDQGQAFEEELPELKRDEDGRVLVPSEEWQDKIVEHFHLSAGRPGINKTFRIIYPRGSLERDGGVSQKLCFKLFEMLESQDHIAGRKRESF